MFLLYACVSLLRIRGKRVFLGVKNWGMTNGKRVFNILNSFRALFIIFLVSGCVQNTNQIPITELKQPPSEKILTHRVERGDTLYAIARRYSIPLADLLSLNDLALFDKIRPGQVIDLDLRKRSRRKASVKSVAKVKVHRAPPSSVRPSVTQTKTTTRKVAPVKLSSRPRTLAQSKTVKRSTPLPKPRVKSHHAKTPASLVNKGGMWQWPLKGQHSYQSNHLSGAQTGIDIRGTKGDSVLCAAAGEVVYAGEGLRAGRGQLVIIKHSGRYLSAYAQIGNVQVKEHQRVKKGQVLAKLVSFGTKESGKNVAALHFEIRDRGKAVDPIRLLPKRG